MQDLDFRAKSIHPKSDPPDAGTEHIAVRYTPPDRKSGRAQRITPLPPANVKLLSHAMIAPGAKIILERTGGLLGGGSWDAPQTNRNGKLLPAKLQKYDLRLATEPA